MMVIGAGNSTSVAVTTTLPLLLLMLPGSLPKYSLSSIRVEGTGFLVEAHAEAAHLKHVRHTRSSIWQSGNVPVTPLRLPPDARSSSGLISSSDCIWVVEDNIAQL